MRLPLLSVGVILIAAVVALFGRVNPAYPVAPASAHVVTSKPLPTRSASYVGVHEGDQPNSYALTNTFAKTIGRQPDVDLYYSGWPENFRTSFAQTAYNHGAAVLVDIDPTGVPLQSIANGSQDSYIRSFAQEVAAFGHPVLINFAHEMNGGWYKWGYGHTAPSVFIAAWRHIVNVFRAEGAKNVTWVWTVNALPDGPSVGRWWPGAKYVTWVGIDGYMYSRSDNFENTFGPTLKQIRRVTHKPVFLTETAIGQLAGKASKIPGLLEAIRKNNVLGLLWFDKGQNAGLRHQDWRLEGDKSAVKAFRSGLKKYFRPSPKI